MKAMPAPSQAGIMLGSTSARKCPFDRKPAEEQEDRARPSESPAASGSLRPKRPDELRGEAERKKKKKKKRP